MAERRERGGRREQRGREEMEVRGGRGEAFSAGRRRFKQLLSDADHVASGLSSSASPPPPPPRSEADHVITEVGRSVHLHRPLLQAANSILQHLSHHNIHPAEQPAGGDGLELSDVAYYQSVTVSQTDSQSVSQTDLAQTSSESWEGRGLMESRVKQEQAGCKWFIKKPHSL